MIKGRLPQLPYYNPKVLDYKKLGSLSRGELIKLIHIYYKGLKQSMERCDRLKYKLRMNKIRIRTSMRSLEYVLLDKGEE